VVSEVGTLAKFVAAFAVASLALALWGSPAWAQAELRVEKTDSPDPIIEGQVLTYTVVVENPGNADATDVVLTDDLPANTRFVSVSTTPGDCDTTLDPADPSTGPGTDDVTCELGDIAAGGSATVTIRVRPTRAAVGGTITNTARATTTTPGVGTASDSATTRVLPNIVIDKLDDRDPVRVGSNVLYTLRVTNEGTATIEKGKLVVLDELPIGDVRLVSVDSNFFRCDPLDPLPDASGARAALLLGPMTPLR